MSSPDSSNTPASISGASSSPGSNTPANIPQPPATTIRPATRGTDEEITAAMARLSPSEDREAMAAAHRLDRHFVNLNAIPHVPGEWHWLEAEDEGLARAIGYATPVDVTWARANGELFDVVDTRTPGVVFTPDARFFNPEEQPEGPGHWEYFTVESRQLAWTNFGENDLYHTEDVRYPSAARFWVIREQYMLERGRGDFGLTAQVDLVWIPAGTLDSNISPRTSLEPQLEPNQDNSNPSAPTYPEDVDKEIFDQDPPHHRHDLTNGGEHDQTGAADLHWYRTIYIRGEKFTCDVSTASLDRSEPHKCWIPSKKGEWKQYKHAAKVDWTNKKHIKDLNAWRDQALKRGGWPDKRAIKRDDYSEDQKRWLFDVVSKSDGNPPGTDALKKITKDFNKRWEAKRSQAALSAVCARLSKMWKENDGEFVVKPGRGQANAQAKREREEREESGDSERSQKRPRKEKMEDLDEEPEVEDSEGGDEEGNGEDEERGFGDEGGATDEEDDFYRDVMDEKDG